jgi:hypothetical protein
MILYEFFYSLLIGSLSSELVRRRNIQDPNAWPHIVSPQLVQKKLLDESPKYRIVNDFFIFEVI